MKEAANAQLQLFSVLPKREDMHPILLIPLLRQMVRDGMPNLLDNSPSSRRILDQLDQYLFRQPCLRQPKLQRVLSEELFDLIYELKKLLASSNLNVVSWSLEENKAWFGRFIEKELQSLHGNEEE
jgi:hypothetical protein